METKGDSVRVHFPSVLDKLEQLVKFAVDLIRVGKREGVKEAFLDYSLFLEPKKETSERERLLFEKGPVLWLSRALGRDREYLERNLRCAWRGPLVGVVKADRSSGGFFVYFQ